MTSYLSKIVSILVLMDFNFWQLPVFQIAWGELVSILVLMDFNFWLLTIDDTNATGKRFNPCFDGFQFLTKVSELINGMVFSFNPCFDGFQFLTWQQKTGLLLSYRVSILVLMDFNFWLCYSTRETVFYAFQSLFWWISIFDLSKGHIAISPKYEFQSLFWWISIFDRAKSVSLSITKESFQSLFWWISIFDFLKQSCNIRMLVVSILVLMDFNFWL